MATVLHIGDRIRYATHSLWHLHGTVTAVCRGPHGGDCYIKWDRFPLMTPTEECAMNVERLAEQ